MSGVQLLRALVCQRLTAAAEDIFVLFERTIAEYEETLCRSKEENERQRRLLDAVFNPQLRLHRADVQQQQPWSSSLDQQDPPETRHIKEEQEEVWTNQEGEQLQEEADLTEFTFTPVPVKSEDDDDDEEKPQSSQLHQRQTGQMETGADGEDCGEPEPGSHLQPVSGDSDDDDDEEPHSGLNVLRNKVYNSFGKGLSCSECGRLFFKSSNLKVHMMIHTGEKPFSCDVCGKGFIQKANLQSHQKYHTGEKPFSCDVCHKGFTLSRLLKRHKCGGESSRRTDQMETGADGEDRGEPEPDRNSHPDPHLTPETEEPAGSETDVSDGDWREIKKPQSGLNFQKNTEVLEGQVTFSAAEKQLLLQHSCSECGKTFGNRPNLKVHMRIHTVEKPFICLVCGKIFERGEDLREHMVVHSGRTKLRS